MPRDYFEVKATFQAKAGTYEGKWFDTGFKKGDDPEFRADRLWDRARADAIVADCEGREGTVVDEAKPATQLAPGPVRPDHAAARGQRPLRLLRQDDAVAGAGAV